MICPKCGNFNKDSYKFCAKCGERLSVPVSLNEQTAADPGLESLENDETVILDDVAVFENDETVILDDMAAFENDETVILDDVAAFENDETVILDDVAAFENDETVILDDVATFENDETVMLDVHEPPAFNFRPVYRQEPAAPKDDTAYIDHLRRLKELLDDGIITEDEFTRKKQQILGI